MIMRGWGGEGRGERVCVCEREGETESALEGGLFDGVWDRRGARGVHKEKK